jgi:hypothetical protein
MINSGGKPLSELISNSNCLTNTAEEIKMFLANLEVYGSMPASEHIESLNSFFIFDYMEQCRYLTVT